MSPKEHELNMRILEGSFKVEGITLTDEAKKISNYWQRVKQPPTRLLKISF